MTRLIFVVEGQTEETIVRDVLEPHLAAVGVFAAATRGGKVVAVERGHRQRGGGHYRNWRKDIVRLLSDRSDDLRVTTWFDLYGLPNDFPGIEAARAESDTRRRCELLEAALEADLRRNGIGDERLIPYVQRHETEALVLASLHGLGDWLDSPEAIDGLRRLREELRDLAPEDVNDGEYTAPSKRLQRHVVGYQKVLHGPLAIQAVGLSAVRSSCPRFDGWVRKLESLGTA